MRKATEKEINDFIKYRANHVALVQRIGKVVFDKDFSDHDFDKIAADGEKLNLYALRNAMINGTYHPHGEDKKELDGLAGEHIKSQKHHPEYWDPAISPKNFDDSNPPQCFPSRMPDRYLLEMCCDWAAVALKRNQPLFQWINKNCFGDNKRFNFTDRQKDLIVEYTNKIIDAISREHLEYPGVKYTAKQVEPKIESKLNESEEQIYSDKFKAWFGDWEKDPENSSKVVDDDGKPLVVYHGTSEHGKFDSFKPNTYFSSNPNMASWYTSNDEEWLNNQWYRNENKTYACYLNLRNPMIVDAEDETWDDISFEGKKVTTDELIDIAKSRGYDGLIVKNVIEASTDFGDDYVIFDPNQAKSATDNNGEFSKSSRFNEDDCGGVCGVGMSAGFQAMAPEKPAKLGDGTGLIDPSGKLPLKEYIVESYNKIQESILDVPMKEPYEGVIKDGKMAPECRGQIIETIKLWKKQINFDFNIYKIWAKGSLLTKRYNDTTDLDVGIYTDMNDSQLNLVIPILPKGQNIIVNGEETAHPLDFYVQVKEDVIDLSNFDAVYDVANDKWVKEPENYENEIPLDYLMEVSNFFINGCSIAIRNYENDKVLYQYYDSLDPDTQEITEDEKAQHLAAKKNDLMADLDALRVALRMISSFRTEAYTDGGMDLQINITSNNPHVTIQEQLAKILEKFGIRQKLRLYVAECSKLLGVKQEVRESKEIKDFLSRF